MATYSATLRRGLPRAAGGDAWPPADTALSEEAAATVAVAAAAAAAAAPAVAAPAGAAPAAAAPAAETAPAVTAAAAPADVAATPHPAPAASVRRGLPRVAGGEPWPPASALPAAAAPATAAPATAAAPAPAATAVAPAPAAPAPADPQVAASAPAAAIAGGETLRRGLPREAGGDAWPPAGVSRASAPTEAPAVAPATVPAAPAEQVAAPAASTPAVPAASAPAAAVAVPAGPRAPLTVPRTVWPGRAASHRPAPAPEPTRIGPFTRGQWAGAVIIGGLALLIAAGMAVAAVRWLLSLEFMQDFLTTYPGEYHLPEGAPVGLPAWLGWQHFFNVFLMVLIIRSGLTVRREKRPSVFWTPKRDPKGKVSLTIWFHQSLDLLWIINGAVFIVLLFVTGQWMRIVPTSWEVFPNALSAALQYVSLDWPTENGWVNYNSLQQIAYFTTVFLAAPLAIVTGFRMSGLWPKGNEKLSTAYPIEWARKVHFPTMLYFVAFIIVHVLLVFATGALRNLNHMYGSMGSTDPTAYADNWTGFWLFVLSLVVIAAAWVAARPLVLAPIARMFGTVSGR